MQHILTVTPLLPVVPGETVVALEAGGDFFALAKPSTVTAVMDRAYLITVALWKEGERWEGGGGGGIERGETRRRGKGGES